MVLCCLSAPQAPSRNFQKSSDKTEWEISQLFLWRARIVLINIFGSAGHTASVTTTASRPWTGKAAADDMWANGRGRVPMKTLLTKAVHGLANAEPLSLIRAVWASGSQSGPWSPIISVTWKLVKILTFLGPYLQVFWIRNPGVGPRNLCFNKSSTWFCYMLKFKFWSNSFSICILAAYLVP